jgi:hypothetical protein
MAIGMGKFPGFSILGENMFTFESAYIKFKLLKDKPQFALFSTDSLGGHRFSTDPLLEPTENPGVNYESRIEKEGISYFLKDHPLHPVWEIKAHEKLITFDTLWEQGQEETPFVMTFSQKANHCTVLGAMSGDKKMKFPCLLHFPGMGTFRLYCSDPGISLFYDADRNLKVPFVKITLPAASKDHPDISYRFESVAVYPAVNTIENDTRFDGLRRNYLNIFQVNPRIRALANNSASDACAFTLFLYAEMARQTPELIKGLTAMDLIRNTLDRYLDGMKGYGQVGYAGWHSDFDSSDSAPSLIIAACYYMVDTKDDAWARQNYPAIKAWADKMIRTDRNGDGLIEYGYSGNAGSWDGKNRPANWWDTIGFGHDDAYSNALAYRACRLLAGVAKTLDKADDSHYFDSFARKLKSSYSAAFYNPETGVLAGWRSADGKLHDYYFTFVNSVAISYGLLEKDRSKGIMQALLHKMKEVGYSNFQLGLPGNLVPIADEDYTAHDPRWGYGRFQVYENGGATGCYAYYTLHALFSLGMYKEAEAIFLPMLESYKQGGFQGNCQGSGMTKDWKTWEGACWGYEGFLVDNYLPLLAIGDYQKHRK